MGFEIENWLRTRNGQGITTSYFGDCSKASIYATLCLLMTKLNCILGGWLYIYLVPGILCSFNHVLNALQFLIIWLLLHVIYSNYIHLTSWVKNMASEVLVFYHCHCLQWALFCNGLFHLNPATEKRATTKFFTNIYFISFVNKEPSVQSGVSSRLT